jgi:hypothetical protein
MEDYLNKYDHLNKIIVYNFGLGSGGIGDRVKYFVYLLNLCMKYDIRLCYLVYNIPIEKYLKLKQDKMYITKEKVNAHNISYISHVNDIPYINENIYYIVNPDLFYDCFSYNEINIPLQEIFYFSEEIVVNSNNFLNNEKPYISIHLRLGDKYLETDKSFVLCKEDTRSYNEEKIFDFIEKNNDKIILFFCDNHSYKLKIKEKYDHILITDYEIGHTGLSNTSPSQTLNSVTDFYLLTNSQEIFIASQSGFSIMAAKFKNINLREI